MALSNWDIFAMDHKGKSIAGHWKSPAGIGVEIYKNWLHIHDKKAWVDKAYMFTKPIVLYITEGQLHYKDVKIVAFRGPQNGIYVVAYTDIYKNNYKKHWVEGMIGCGVSGYSFNRYVGVNKGSLRWFSKKLNEKEMLFAITGGDGERDKKLSYKSHILDIPDKFRTINLLKGKRYNQGDAFFSVHLDTDIQATKPSKAKKTIASKMIGK